MDMNVLRNTDETTVNGPFGDDVSLDFYRLLTIDKWLKVNGEAIYGKPESNILLFVEMARQFGLCVCIMFFRKHNETSH